MTPYITKRTFKTVQSPLKYMTSLYEKSNRFKLRTHNYILHII